MKAKQSALIKQQVFYFIKVCIELEAMDMNNCVCGTGSFQCVKMLYQSWTQNRNIELLHVAGRSWNKHYKQ